MSGKKHAKDTYISVLGVDLSPYTDTSEFTRSKDSHDVTTYGKDDHVFGGGLNNSKFSMGGFYQVGASGTPATVLEDAQESDDPVAVIRRVEGTGSGKPQQSFNALCIDYKESSPVAEYIKWTAEFQVSDAVTGSTQ